MSRSRWNSSLSTGATASGETGTSASDLGVVAEEGDLGAEAGGVVFLLGGDADFGGSDFDGLDFGGSDFAGSDFAGSDFVGPVAAVFGAVDFASPAAP